MSTYEGFSADERAAMKDHATEQKKAARRRGSAADKAEAARQDLLAKIAEMGDTDRAIAERVHEIITTTAPELAPKLWYGMPAYQRDGKNVCFFQPAGKFKVRYATLGFEEAANLDDGDMWPTAYALTEITPDVEARIAALVKQALA
jgi:uncharacterized protein YdhG (YjbR/CyaY superfamily)